MWEEAHSEHWALLFSAKTNLGLQFISVGTGCVVAPFRAPKTLQNPAEALSCFILPVPMWEEPHSEHWALLFNAKNNLGLQFIPVGTGCQSLRWSNISTIHTMLA